MYGEFDDCGHLLDELFDYAREIGLEPSVVDAVFDQAYHDSRRLYNAILWLPDYDDRLRQVNTMVQKKAMSELERLAEKRSDD